MENQNNNDNFSKIAIVFDHDGTLVDTRGLNPLVFPKIPELLSELSQLNVDLYLWSLRPRSSLVRITKEVGIFHYFRDLGGADDGLNPKPHPEGLMRLLDGYEKNFVCHIGDGGGDYNGAKMLKIPFIAACWNDPSYGKQWDELKKEYPNMKVAYSPIEIIPMLREFGVLR